MWGPGTGATLRGLVILRLQVYARQQTRLHRTRTASAHPLSVAPYRQLGCAMVRRHLGILRCFSTTGSPAAASCCSPRLPVSLASL